MKTSVKYDPTRDLHPHRAAVAAMVLFGSRYAALRCGSMGFWDLLSEPDRRLCRDLVAQIEAAPAENQHG